MPSPLWHYPPADAARQPGVLRRCPACGSTLLWADFVGLPAGPMDKALNHHNCRACIDALALAKEARASVAAAAAASGSHASAGTEQADALWPDFEPPLVYLSRVGKTQQVADLLNVHGSTLLDACGGVDAVGHFGATALHYAAAHNAPELVAALLAAGAGLLRTQDDPHASLPGGRTPLFFACCE